MKRLLSLLQQDMLLFWRHGLAFFTGLLLLIMIALVILLPESLATETPQYFYDATDDNRFEQFLRASGAEASLIVDSEQELQTILADTNRGIGVVYEGTLQTPRFRLLTVGALPEENVNLLRATLDNIARAMRGALFNDQFDVKLLRPPSDAVPVNLSSVPVALVFEVVLLGFSLGAVMIFQEKQEGVNRALRVSPVTTIEYLLSKNVLFLLLSTVYGGLLLFAAFGLDADYGRALVLIILTSSLMTLVGLAIAVFFNNISEWFFAGMSVLIVNMLPILSYAIPTFAPDWLTAIPSYPVLFGVREILFPTGDAAFMGPLVVQLLVYNAVAFGLAYLAVDRKLMKAA